MQLQREGHVVHTRTDDNEYVASGTADSSLIRDAELRILDEVIQEAAESRSLQVTDSSDEQPKSSAKLAWPIAEQGERVPYQQELTLRFLPLTKDDVEWVKAELARLK